MASGFEYKWCVDLPTDGNSDVLYYLHGGGGDENSWTSAVDNLAITSEWNLFGANWLLTWIAKKNEPALESKLGITVGRRMLKGESTGRFNASMLWLKRPDLLLVESQIF